MSLWSDHHRSGMTMCQLVFASFLFFSYINLSHCISGWIEPRSVIAERGDKVTLICGVDGFDETLVPSENLTFFNQTSQETIDSRYVRKINSTSIELTLHKVPEQKTTVYCKYGDQGVTTIELYIGHKPDPIPKVDCYSYNWVDLNCSFKIPENHVPVQYELKYSQGERNKHGRQYYECEFVSKQNNIFSCRFSENKYRRSSPFFFFNLTAINHLGSHSQDFEFDNFKNIIPSDGPSKFETIGEPKSDSVFTSWRLTGKLAVLAENMDFEIKVNSSCSGEQIIFLKEKEFYMNSGVKIFNYTIPLNYTYDWYVIKIRMKISRADDIEKMWSPWIPLNIDVKLAPRHPETPPEINTGSFNILPNNDVYVYWKNVPQCKHNGVNFTYSVTSDINGGIPTELKESFAIYRKNYVLSTEGATIKIRSQNAIGLSNDASILKIPSKINRLMRPKAIEKRYVTENTTYVLTWAPPDNAKDVTSYTIFWCKSKTEGENKCDDKSFDFKVIDAKEKRVFEHKSSESVNFAISANSANSTSGMFWTTCTTGESREIGKIRSAWIPRISSTEIDIEWKLECTDKGIVVGYEIEYCLTTALKNFECIGPLEKLNITGQLEHMKYTLTNLTPYKTYGIVIKMFSSSTMGPPSDHLVHTTLEDGEFILI